MLQDVPNPKVGIIASTIGASPPNDPASDTFSGTSAIPLHNHNKKAELYSIVDNVDNKMTLLLLVI